MGLLAIFSCLNFYRTTIKKNEPAYRPSLARLEKMQYIHEGLDGSQTIIHYNGKWVNGVLKAVDDFKFK